MLECYLKIKAKQNTWTGFYANTYAMKALQIK